MAMTLEDIQPFFHRGEKLSLEPKIEQASAYAPSNIALIKYWGKRPCVGQQATASSSGSYQASASGREAPPHQGRDLGHQLNLPLTRSLSLSMGDRGTQTRLKLCSAEEIQELSGGLRGDYYTIDGSSLHGSAAYDRLKQFLDPFRPKAAQMPHRRGGQGLGLEGCRGSDEGSDASYFLLESISSVPVAAGLASSASGFAAVAIALDKLFGWELPQASLSRLARMGSGSASRSIGHGLMLWECGDTQDGYDSYAHALEPWDELMWAAILVDTSEKAVASRTAMERTFATSPFAEKWPDANEQDLDQALKALSERNFTALGEAVEASAYSMHALMLSSRPSIRYMKPLSLELLQAVANKRAQGLKVYATMDAGPNVKILFRRGDLPLIKEWLEELCDEHAASHQLRALNVKKHVCASNPTAAPRDLHLQCRRSMARSIDYFIADPWSVRLNTPQSIQ